MVAHDRTVTGDQHGDGYRLQVAQDAGPGYRPGCAGIGVGVLDQDIPAEQDPILGTPDGDVVGTVGLAPVTQLAAPTAQGSWRVRSWGLLAVPLSRSSRTRRPRGSVSSPSKRRSGVTTLSVLSSSSSARRCRMCPWCIVRSSGVRARPVLSAPRASSSSIRGSPARLVELGWLDIL